MDVRILLEVVVSANALGVPLYPWMIEAGERLADRSATRLDLVGLGTLNGAQFRAEIDQETYEPLLVVRPDDDLEPDPGA